MGQHIKKDTIVSNLNCDSDTPVAERDSCGTPPAILEEAITHPRWQNGETR